MERRVDDSRVAEMLTAIHHLQTGQQLAAERAFLAALDGSCETPIAALATLKDGTLTLRGELLRTDGSECLRDQQSCAIEDGPQMAEVMAKRLLGQAGKGFFDWSR